MRRASFRTASVYLSWLTADQVISFSDEKVSDLCLELVKDTGNSQHVVGYS